MKLQLSVLFFMAAALSACTKGTTVDNGNFDTSYNAWLRFKAQSNNSYRYTVQTQSWTGYRSETTISVRLGEITERSYKSEDVNRQPFALVQQWSETRDSLNTHPNGAEAITLDEVYQKAKTDWLIKRQNVTYYFRTENNGMISSCGYVPDGCQDDCFRGIHISLINEL